MVYNMFKEYLTHQTYRTEKRVKTSGKKRTKQQHGVDPMNYARFIQHPSNKATFILWVVYTDNAALMVGYNTNRCPLYILYSCVFYVIKMTNSKPKGFKNNGKKQCATTVCICDPFVCKIERTMLIHQHKKSGINIKKPVPTIIMFQTESMLFLGDFRPSYCM